MVRRGYRWGLGCAGVAMLAALAAGTAGPGAAGATGGQAWRREAEQRIETIRKAELEVVVEDREGRAVQGARVAVRMQRHAFPFGTAVAESLLVSPAGEQYRQELVRHFNFAVLENALKWPNWETWGRTTGQRALEWLAQQGIPVRGHTLVWPGWQHIPAWVRFLENDPAAVADAVREHILEVAGALRGRVVAWDVLNEPYTNRDLMRLLGDEAMVDWFRWARQADPQAQLFINDFGILSAGGEDRAHQDAYFETIRFLIQRGAPLDAIGMQGHFEEPLTPPERVLAILDRFATLGKPIWITEFDVDVPDEQRQAAFFRDFLTAIFSHPAVEGFLMWGFWDGAHWKRNAPLFRRDWSLKPSGQVWRDLVYDQWWTRAEGVTDERGRFEVRGFLGDYEVEVSAGGQSQKTTLRLSREGARVKVELDI